MSAATPSIPRVFVERQTSQETEVSYGAGFVIGDGLLLTALHILDAEYRTCTLPRLTDPALRITLEFSNQNGQCTKVPAQVDSRFWSSANVETDWVVLQFDQKQVPDAMSLQPCTLRSYYESVPWHGFGYLTSEEGIALSGSLLPLQVQGASTRWQVLCDQPLSGDSLRGLSGGPCLLSGQVVGMFVEELSKGGFNRLNTGFVVPLSVIKTQQPTLWADWNPNLPPLHEGLVPLRARISRDSFRNYLTSEHLPYYSRQQHLESHPAPLGLTIADETQLLGTLRERPGLIISGSGGYGKTRLLLELGVIATKQGHWVCRVREGVTQASLDKLLAELPSSPSSPSSPSGKMALLLIDYIETNANFFGLLNWIESRYDQGRDIRYIATCRASYYQSQKEELSRYAHLHVELSTVDETPLGDWLYGMRESAIEHIVQQLDEADRKDVRTLSNGVPVFAVFAFWLHQRRHLRAQQPLQTEAESVSLRQLLRENEFDQYVASRLSAMFRGDERTRSEVRVDLAELLALLPRSPDGLTERQEHLLNVLEPDGWVERECGDGVTSLVAAHDILVDRCLLNLFDAQKANRERFVRRLLAEAVRVQAVPSALMSLGRLAGQSAISTINWPPLLRESLRNAPAAWREARLLLLRSPLLTEQQSIDLLDTERTLFADCVSDPRFHRILGWQLTRAFEQNDQELLVKLAGWVRSALPSLDEDNYLLSKALPLGDPETQSAALRWLQKHPAELQTHYLLRQWLLCSLPLAPVQSIAANWLLSFRSRLKWSFLCKPWLEHGGDIETVRRPLLQWVAAHGQLESAEFVYKAWLDAGGDVSSVKASLLQWVAAHGQLESAGFVYPAWLEAGQPLESIKDAVCGWLSCFKHTEGAKFVTKRLSAERNLPVKTVQDILDWSRRFCTDQDAIWRLSRLARHLQIEELAETVLDCCEYVLPPLFAKRQLSVNLQRNIESITHNLRFAQGLGRPPLQSRLHALLAAWLRHPKACTCPVQMVPYIQTPTFLEVLLELLQSGNLSIENDREHLSRLVSWLNTWDQPQRQRLAPWVEKLKQRFSSADDLWQRIDLTQAGE